MSVKIVIATTSDDCREAKALMEEYCEVALGDDYQIGGAGLKEELANFPGPYTPPYGAIYLAKVNDQYCGCLALRPFSDKAGEVMRMYVKESFRGRGIAEKLMHEVIAFARRAGYQRLYLDSLQRFTAAHKLYEKLGFSYCNFYDPNTTERMKREMVFMTLSL